MSQLKGEKTTRLVTTLLAPLTFLNNKRGSATALQECYKDSRSGYREVHFEKHEVFQVSGCQTLASIRICSNTDGWAPLPRFLVQRVQSSAGEFAFLSSYVMLRLQSGQHILRITDINCFPATFRASLPFPSTHLCFQHSSWVSFIFISLPILRLQVTFHKECLK